MSKFKLAPLIIIMLLINGCVIQPTITCLDPLLKPSTTIPPHLLYAGYFVGNPTSAASTSIEGFIASMDELKGQGNVVVISYLPQEILHPSINPDVLIVEKILSAKARGFKIVIEIPTVFFDFNFSKMRFNVSSLSLGYQKNWNHFKELITPHLTSIVGFYPFDEPYWNAFGSGVPSSDMKIFLEEIAVTIKTDFPNIPLIFIEAYPMVNEDLQLPKGWDWIGMDCYGSFDKCGAAGSERSIPEYYNVLKSKMTPNQKLVVIPDAFLFTETPSPIEKTALVRRAKQFLDWVSSEPKIVAVVPFTYNNLKEEHISGAREMCPVREFYKVYLESARAQFLTKPSINITCPTNLSAGSSGTCQANIRGAIVSGHWTVNGTKTLNSDNMSTFTWNNVPAGTFKIQGVGKDNSGKIVLSNTITVNVH